MVLARSIWVCVSSVVAVTAAVFKRDVQTLASNIDDVDSKAKAFTTAAGDYQGGFLQAIGISNADNDLITALNTAASTAGQIQAPLSQEDFGMIAPKLQALPPDVSSGLVAMKAKRDFLKDAGVISVAITAINNTKAAHDGFSDAILLLLPGPAQDQGRQQKADEDAKFDDAIAWFQEVA